MTWYLPCSLFMIDRTKYDTSLDDCFMPRKVGMSFAAILNTSPLSTKNQLLKYSNLSYLNLNSKFQAKPMTQIFSINFKRYLHNHIHQSSKEFQWPLIIIIDVLCNTQVKYQFGKCPQLCINFGTEKTHDSLAFPLFIFGGCLELVVVYEYYIYHINKIQYGWKNI